MAAATAPIAVKKPWIVPIPGTTKLHRLQENNDSASVELSSGELKAIEDAVSKVEIVGERYLPAAQKTINR
jgi:aryl-alcohol dehydrogenase-like predicted oxidoreductase